MELGSALSASGVAFSDLRFLKYHNFKPSDIAESSTLQTISLELSSMSILGIAIGSFFAGKLIAVLGRRKTVIFSNVTVIIISFA